MRRRGARGPGHRSSEDGNRILFDVDGAVIAGRVVEVSEKDRRRKLGDLIHPEARELLAAHRHKGYTIVLVSSMAVSEVDPLVDALGAGVVVAPGAVQEHAAANGVDLGRSHAYARGRKERWRCCRRSGTRIPSTPARRSAAWPTGPGWEVLRFDSRSRADVERPSDVGAADVRVHRRFAVGTG